MDMQINGTKCIFIQFKKNSVNTKSIHFKFRTKSKSIITITPFRHTFIGPKKGRLIDELMVDDLLGWSVFGDGFGSFWHSVFGQFTRQQQTDSSLDLPWSDCWSLVVVSQSGCFSCDSFEDVIYERIHDWHGLWWDTSVWVNLFQHLKLKDIINKFKQNKTIRWFTL